ncbi:efflux RND transporter permease subunit [Veronia pacifica]|uniref:efflux RND transporter permease subunit n=1 Tax=Veronia pacifica TaxID=1080227 RepID=UPI000A94F791|nr:efflux RND transporter permease subunit [Veronia pacifica]
MNKSAPQRRGIIYYFANNSVASNLMAIFLVVIGALCFIDIQRQIYPNKKDEFVNIYATFPGASPEELESLVLEKIENTLIDLPGITDSLTTAKRGLGHISLKIDSKTPPEDMVYRIKERVDAITGFPEGLESTVVSQGKIDHLVMELVVTGDVPLPELVPIATNVGNELRQLTMVSDVVVRTPEFEIAFEIDPTVLRQYNLTLSSISEAIKRFSANLSAGHIVTASGDLSVRIENQYYEGKDFGDIPVKLGANGGELLLQDIAVIKDGFTERERHFKFSGANAINITVNATDNENMVKVANAVRQFIEQKNPDLPPGIEIKAVLDMTYYLNERLEMMLNNLLEGALLVGLMLAIFLNVRLAVWAMLGLPVSFFGAVILMYFVGISLNVISLFAFIMVLGIVVDNAIIISESVSNEQEHSPGKHGTDIVIRGVERVATPAIFGVLTTVAMFVPFLFASGSGQLYFFEIAAVSIFCLLFSLLQSKLILPSNLAQTSVTVNKPNKYRQQFNSAFQRLVNGPYRRFILCCVNFRWTIVSAFLCAMCLTWAMFNYGYVRSALIPKVPQDFPSIHIHMNKNTSGEQMVEVLKDIETRIKQIDHGIESEYGQKMISEILSMNLNRNTGVMIIKLVDDKKRPVSTFDLSRRWREELPIYPGVRSLFIVDSFAGEDNLHDIGISLTGQDVSQLNQAASAVMALLRPQTGVFDVSSTLDLGSQELRLTLLPIAYKLGLDLSTIASQVGHGFYGGIAQRISRYGEDVRVVVRYPKHTREAVSSLAYTVIKTPQGKQVMLGDIAKIELKPGLSEIRREKGERSVYIFGSLDEELITADDFFNTLKEGVIPSVKNAFPDVNVTLNGEVNKEADAQKEQAIFFVVGMMAVYILLAVPLRSYAQPIIIMLVIPFSFILPIWVHIVLDMDINMMSTFGLVAAAGVVINDSLVIMDFINRYIKKGHSLESAVVEAGCKRFRAITLTSITTFVGLLPIMFESSLQAQFVIPMAVSLAFAVLFATLVSLILVPCSFLIWQDVRMMPTVGSDQKSNA